jgi:hypothetical protein
MGLMQKLDLDFRRSRRGSPWLGRVMLAVAAAVCLDAALAYFDLRSMTRQGEAQLAKRSPAAPGARVSAPELAAVRETVERLSLPWDALFKALESAADDKVTLTAIEPDTAKGTVTITGEGKDYLAALSYVSNLGRTEGVDRVQLVRHEEKEKGNGAVTFAVSAAWSAR